MVRPNCSRTFAYSTALSTQSDAPPTASAAYSVRVRASAALRAPGSVLSPTATSVRTTRPERRLRSRFSGTSIVTPAAVRSTTSMSSPLASSSTSASPAPRTTPASPEMRPPDTVRLPPKPIAAVWVPSTRPGSRRAFCSSVPTAAITDDTTTVGTNGPGATARPSSSMTTTSSGSPNPDPPYFSSTCKPSQPNSAKSDQNGGRPSASESSSSRAARRAFCAVRNERATLPSSRWSSVSAIDISYLLDRVDQSLGLIKAWGRNAARHPGAGTGR